MLTSTIMVPRADRVAAEIIEDDAIVINVLTGTYYSTEGTGGWVWCRCAAGRSLVEIVAEATAIFAVSEAQFSADLEQFVSALKEEDLVTEQPAVDVTADPGESSHAERKAYQPPKLSIYRDLKSVLALDPPMPRLTMEASQEM
jgi:hypothetical protein